GDVELVVPAHLEHVVLHGVDGRGGGGDRVGDRVLQEAPDELVDVDVEGGGVQQPLPAGRCLPEQFAEHREEAEVAHVVGLVQDADLDVLQGALALADQVVEPAGGGDDEVDAAAQRVDLLAHGHAADDDLHAQAEAAAEGFEGVVHLEGELAGGDEDHRAGTAGSGPDAGDAGHGGQAEGEGLAGAGLAAAEHVGARQHVGDGRALDGERGVDALPRQAVHQRLGQAQQLERGRALLWGRLGQGSVKYGHEIRAFQSKWHVTSAKGRARTYGGVAVQIAVRPPSGRSLGEGAPEGAGRRRRGTRDEASGVLMCQHGLDHNNSPRRVSGLSGTLGTLKWPAPPGAPASSRRYQTLKPSIRSWSRPSSVILSGPHGGIQTQLIFTSETMPSSAECAWSSMTSVSGQAALVRVMSMVATGLPSGSASRLTP